MEWLADAGHECRILTTARFESRVTSTIEEHLRAQGVDTASLAPPANRHDRSKKRVSERPVVRYAVRGVPVTLLMTRHNDERRPDRAESNQYLALLNAMLGD